MIDKYVHQVPLPSPWLSKLLLLVLVVTLPSASIDLWHPSSAASRRGIYEYNNELISLRIHFLIHLGFRVAVGMVELLIPVVARGGEIPLWILFLRPLLLPLMSSLLLLLQLLKLLLLQM